MSAKSKAILEQIGDPRVINEELESFRDAARTLSSKHPRMIDKYPKQWIAVYRGKVRAQGSTFWSLMDEVDKKKLPREQVIVRYIDKNLRTMIL